MSLKKGWIKIKHLFAIFIKPGLFYRLAYCPLGSLQLLYEPSFKGYDELSLEVLKINTLLFHNCFNTYDNYGEALAKAMKKGEAIFTYKKSVELNPQNKGGKKALKELQKKIGFRVSVSVQKGKIAQKYCCK